MLMYSWGQEPGSHLPVPFLAMDTKPQHLLIETVRASLLNENAIPGTGLCLPFLVALEMFFGLGLLV